MSIYNAIRKLKPQAVFRMDNPDDYESLHWDKVNLLPVEEGGTGAGPAPTVPDCAAVMPEADAEAKAANDRENALQALQDIDKASIRGMREFLTRKFAGDPDMPKQVLEHEADAEKERGKL